MPTQVIRHRRALAEIAQRSTPHAQTWRDHQSDDIEADGFRMLRNAAAHAAIALALTGALVVWAVEILVASL